MAQQGGELVAGEAHLAAVGLLDAQLRGERGAGEMLDGVQDGMRQEWLQFSGVVADAVGFALLAVEWHRTLRADKEARERELEQLARPLRVNTVAVISDAEVDKRRDAIRQETKKRLRWFWPGIALVLLGFALQGLGTIPSGLP